MKKIKIFLHKKKRLLKAFQGKEILYYFLDLIRYKITSNKLIYPRDVHSYKIINTNYRVKSPSLRLLKIMKMIYFNDNYIKNQKKYFQVLGLRNNCNILDVGANIGYYSLIYSFLFPDSKIYSFEPSALNFKYLEYHSSQRNNIKIYNFGLSNNTEVRTLQMPSISQNPSVLKSSDNTGLLSIYGNSGKLKEKINLKKLDDVISLIKIDYIKIDVEGNEFKVLLGAEETIRLHKPILNIEINIRSLSMSNTTPDDVIKYLNRLDYIPYIYENENIEKLALPIEKKIDQENWVKNITFLPKIN